VSGSRFVHPASLKPGDKIAHATRGVLTVISAERWPDSVGGARYDVKFQRPDGSVYIEVGVGPAERFTRHVDV
jgi:hypothetical protein